MSASIERKESEICKGLGQCIALKVFVQIAECSEALTADAIIARAPLISRGIRTDVALPPGCRYRHLPFKQAALEAEAI